MLRFILGRAGSGKTVYVRSLLSDLARQGAENMILIVPEQFSFESERAILELLGAKDFGKIEILSFTRLADRVFREYGGLSGRRLDDGGRIILMNLAFQAVRERLRIYDPRRSGIQLTRRMIDTVNELKMNRISAGMLMATAEAMEECGLKNKLHDVALLFEAYEGLTARSYVDPQDDLTRLSAVLEKHDFFAGRIVAVDSFKSFTGQESEVLIQIMSQSAETYLTLCTDSLEDHENGMGIFSPVKKTARKLTAYAKASGIKIAVPVKLTEIYRFQNEPLRILEKNLFAPACQSYEEECIEVTVSSAQDIYEECELTACRIKRLLREEGFRCREIMILARNIEDYGGVMEAALQKYGVPVFVDARQRIDSQPLMIFVEQAFAVIHGGFATDDLFCYLKTGMAGLTTEEIADLENYALVWKLTGKHWKETWTGHPDGFSEEWTQGAVERLEELNRLRQRVVSPLLRFKSACESMSARELAKAVFALLTETEAPLHLKELAAALNRMGERELARQQNRIWDLLMRILDQTVFALSETPVDSVQYGELLKLVIQSQEIGDIPQGLDEIHLGSADRVRAVNPRVVFLLGANEGRFPGIPAESGILSETDRKMLCAMGLELSDSLEEKVLEERFLAYNSAAAPSERLIVSYTGTDPAGGSSSPSALVSQIQKILPGCTKADSVSLSVMDWIESEVSAFEQTARNWSLNTEVSASLKAFFAGREQYAGLLGALGRAAERLPAKIRDRDKAARLFGQNLYTSASGIEAFYKCRFAYFCRYGLRAQPRNVAELNAVNTGNAVHYLMERLLRETGKDLIQLSEPERSQIIESILSDYLETCMGGSGNKSGRFMNLYRRVRIRAEELVSHVVSEFSQSRFEPVEFEMKIDRDGTLPPLLLSAHDGRLILVRGSVDRVDVMEEGGVSYLRVVDYKTGSTTFSLSDASCGLNLQMLIYLMAILQNGKERFGEIVPAGVLYMPSKPSDPSLPRNADAHTVAEEKAKNYRLNGLVLEDTLVIEGMERDAKGIFVPVSISGKGKVKGTCISLLLLEKLTKKIEALIVGMEEALYSGDISAVPLKSKSLPCEYCDYQAACGHERCDPIRKTPGERHAAALKRLEAESDGETQLD